MNSTLLRPAASGNDRELVDLRLAECDYFLKRPRNAKTALRPYLEGASRQGEALFFYALSLRALNEIDEYLKTIRRVADQFPTETWADDALGRPGGLLRRHRRGRPGRRGLSGACTHASRRAATPSAPRGKSAGRRSGRETSRTRPASSTGRPPIFRAPTIGRCGCTGRDARTRRCTEPPLATARYTLEVTDYANTYHGRLAAKRLAEQGVRLPERRLVVDVTGPPAAVDVPQGERLLPARVSLPANAPIIRALLALDLFDQAIDELRYAQKAWGDSSAIEATLAWIYWQQGRAATGTEQFALCIAARSTR